MTIFDGVYTAAQKEKTIAEKVKKLSELDVHLTIAAILFKEDAGSLLYTDLKREAAKRVGITYLVEHFSLNDDPKSIIKKIKSLNKNPAITGIIIQKPSRKIWISARTSSEEGTRAGESSTSTPAVTEFSDWWKTLTIALSAKKDVDGLHPKTMKLLKKNSWREQGRVMPATARAVIEILEIAKSALQHSSNQINSKSKHIIVGTSDIVGQPLFFELKNQGYPVEMIGRAELQLRIESGIFLTDAHVIISATGSKNLITGQMITSGTVVIDVGEPSPDVEFKTVAPKAAFITPVPGGVGPMTVVCLLENCLDLVK